MKILFHNIYDSLNENNAMFEAKNVVLGDDLLVPLEVLDDYAKLRNIEVGTRSKIDQSKADAVVFIDYPNLEDLYIQNLIKLKIPLYLMICESPMANTVLKDDPSLNIFHRIFTYDDSWVDGERFFKINYSFIPSFSGEDIEFEEKKFCTIIAGNKKSSHINELYSFRKRDIRWFEKNHPNQLDLYGIGWDRINYGDKLPFRVMNRFNINPIFLGLSYPSYKGAIERKKVILNQYKFSLCYENMKDVPGYITEKIFDSMFAGCIPIYLGANNIDEHIPVGCYIDRRDFPLMEDLYKYMKSISRMDYLDYIKNIKAFLKSNKMKKFSCDTFACTILDALTADNVRLM